MYIQLRLFSSDALYQRHPLLWQGKKSGVAIVNETDRAVFVILPVNWNNEFGNSYLFNVLKHSILSSFLDMREWQ